MSEFRSPAQGRGGEPGPFRSAVPFGRVFGVPLRLHWSAPLLVVLLGFSLGAGTLPAWAPGRSHATYALAGTAGALLLLASLLLHEGAHAVVARRAGVQVQDMTVWALGGATLMGRADQPRSAFKIAVAGPLTSLVLGGLSLGAAAGLLRGAHWTVPGLEGRPTGVVSLRRLAQVPSDARHLTRVSQVAQPIARTPVAGPDEDLADVLQRLTPGMPLRILVMDGGQLAGIVTAHDVSRHLQRRLALTRPGLGPGAF
nr:site-2 protease family protein [Streptacidiphilus neutrinimicus]